MVSYKFTSLAWLNSRDWVTGFTRYSAQASDLVPDLSKIFENRTYHVNFTSSLVTEDITWPSMIEIASIWPHLRQSFREYIQNHQLQLSEVDPDLFQIFVDEENQAQVLTSLGIHMKR